MNIETIKQAHLISEKMRKKICFNPESGKWRNYLNPEEQIRINKVINRVTGIDNFGNSHRAKIEIHNFINDPPKKYFAYLIKRKSGRVAVTNWTGKHLAFARISRTFIDNFGGDRITFKTGKAINGLKYYGVGYCGFGGYCRIKSYKLAGEVKQ